MKYIILLCDGMSDLPCPGLGGKTPMELANKPNMDRLIKSAQYGLVKTVPNGMKPGSDIANLSVMGYDPALYYTGRSPLEAVSMGINLGEFDTALRVNLVTLSDDDIYSEKSIIDYCAGDISSEEAALLIKFIDEELGNDVFKFYSGVSYRHCLVWKNNTENHDNLTPPHDITGRVIKDYLPRDTQDEILLDFMKKSYDIIKDHPVNKKRIDYGKRPANSIWPWGAGQRMSLPKFKDQYGISGAVISAVDLLKGIGITAGLDIPFVESATGYIDTNWNGKVDAAISALKNGADFAYIHIEAPDECGHRGEAAEKIRSIELIDKKILSHLIDEINEDYRIAILPDHPTPLVTRTHSRDPVPYLIYDSRVGESSGVSCFTEKEATKGEFLNRGTDIMKKLIEKN